MKKHSFFVFLPRFSIIELHEETETAKIRLLLKLLSPANRTPCPLVEKVHQRARYIGQYHHKNSDISALRDEKDEHSVRDDDEQPIADRLHERPFFAFIAHINFLSMN